MKGCRRTTHDPASTQGADGAAPSPNTLAVATVSQVSVVDVLDSPTGTLSALPSCTAARRVPGTHGRNSIARTAAATSAAPVATPSRTRRSSRHRHGCSASSASAISPHRAVPDHGQRIVVYTVPLNDVAGAVALVRSRILLAAAIGLLVALLTGVLVARALTRRVLRLESTAQRVAQGDFATHFSDSSGDELGQLARALAHMQSQLEGLESARRRFIATASHELRTPIFSLGGFLELIQDEALDEETRRQFVGQVREQVERLGKLATQLLDLTRLESGSVELSPITTDLGVLARAVGAEFVPALAQHDSRLDLRLPEQPIRVVCDPERVAQLLRILIDNALAHTPPGTEVITVNAGRRRTAPACRCTTAARGSPRRRSGASSSRSTAPTARAAPDWAWRSRASWRSAHGGPPRGRLEPGRHHLHADPAAGSR